MTRTNSHVEILLVEDSPSDRVLTLAALQAAQLESKVHCVEDGVSALAFLRKESPYSAMTRPDLILLDLNLPKKDGREVLAEIKADQDLRTIPVVVLSTSDAAKDVLDAYAKHANSFITKSMAFDEFGKAIASWSKYWCEVVRLPTRPDPSFASSPGGLLLRTNLPSKNQDPPWQADKDNAVQVVAEGETSSAKDGRSECSSGHDAESNPVEGGIQAKERTLKGGEKLSLLLVEDGHSDVLIFRRKLTQSTTLDFDITVATRLKEAVDLLRSRSFDVILTDLGLPDAQGLETYRGLRPAAPELPIIILTGLDDEDIGAHLLREGAQDYLVKNDLSASTLVRTIRYAIDRKNAQDQLQRAQRMEALGQLAGGVAHDFNNLLTIIEGCATLLLEEPSAENARSWGEEILSAARRGATLTKQLLAFSRKRVMAHEPIDFNELVSDVMRLVRRVIGETITVRLSLAGGAQGVRGDIASLEQVLVNLIINARDAMPQGGTLTLTTQRVELQQKDALALGGDAQPGQFCRFSVQDTGHGIDPLIQRRIWEPFFSTKNERQGTGLGLATAQGIVRQHGGWIDVSSRPAQGTTFQVYLPHCELHEETSPPLPLQQEGSPKADRLRVLLVEDDPSVRSVATMLLTLDGHSVRTSTCGPEALEIFEVSPQAFDVVISDMVMPGGLSGKDLVRRLREQRNDIPIILSSGYSEDLEHLNVSEEGIVFLSKPYGNTALREALSRVT